MWQKNNRPVFFSYFWCIAVCVCFFYNVKSGAVGMVFSPLSVGCLYKCFILKSRIYTRAVDQIVAVKITIYYYNNYSLILFLLYCSLLNSIYRRRSMILYFFITDRTRIINVQCSILYLLHTHKKSLTCLPLMNIIWYINVNWKRMCYDKISVKCRTTNLQPIIGKSRCIEKDTLTLRINSKRN